MAEMPTLIQSWRILLAFLLLIAGFSCYHPGDSTLTSEFRSLENSTFPSILRPGSRDDLPLKRVRFLGLCHSGLDHLSLTAFKELYALDLRAARIDGQLELPESLRRLDLRYARLKEHPKSFPPRLNYLGIDAHQLSEKTQIPATVRGLAVNFAGDLNFQHARRMALIRRKLPPNLQLLEVEGIDVKRLYGLPTELRELRLVATQVRTLQGLPLGLDRLFLHGNPYLSLEHLPPYLTRYHHHSPLYAHPVSFPTAEQARFLEKIGDLSSANNRKKDRCLQAASVGVPLMRKEELKKLMLKLAPGQTVGEAVGWEDIEGSQPNFPADLEHLEIHGSGTALDRNLPLPDNISLPSSLRYIHLSQVDPSAWLSPLSELDSLETVILNDVTIGGPE